MRRADVNEVLTRLTERNVVTHNLGDPFKVLIGTILSQRTRDEQTDKAAEALFSKFSTPEEIANADVEAIEKLIKPAGFYRVKAKKVKEVARLVLEQHGGAVPRDFEALMRLPSVGRKTANCVLVYGFGVPAIPVDTHVHRISNRLGWARTSTPEKTEAVLVKLIPKELWLGVNTLLVAHGRNVCRPVGPRCGECRLWDICPSNEG